jgi:hypothetical protein
MIITTITIIFFTILFIFLSSLVISGYLYKPKIVSDAFLLNFDMKSENPNCLSTNVNCNTDDDCDKVCKRDSNVKITCQSIQRPPGDPLFGKTQKICKPKKPTDVQCNSETGGVWVWTGDNSTNTQQWSCVCAYPSYYGNEKNGCTRLNNGVCSNGKFTYNAYIKNGPPSQEDCKCNDGYIKLNKAEINQGIPICVPESIRDFYNYENY